MTLTDKEITLLYCRDYLVFARTIEARVHEELRKQEPFGWWHQGDTEDESDFHLAESGAGMDCKNCIALFAHAAPIPPITPSQQEALSENLQNLRKALSSNKTGLLGASWHKGRSKFQAQIVINRKNHHLGYFDNVQTAHHAYLKAKQKLHPFAPSILEGK